MLSKDEFEKIVNGLREKLDETSVALVSEELLATLSAYNTGFDDYEKSVEEVEKLKSEKEELLKVNGKLYQKIGFDNEEKDDETKGESYILNTSSKKFHNVDCSGAASISEGNKKEYTGTRQALIDDGYTPCGICKP